MSTVCCVYVQKRNFAHFRKCRKSAIIAGSQFLAIPQNVFYAQLAFLLIHKQLVLLYVMRVYAISHKNYVVAKNCCACKTFMGADLWALVLSSSQCHFFVTRRRLRKVSSSSEAVELSGAEKCPCMCCCDYSNQITLLDIQAHTGAFPCVLRDNHTEDTLQDRRLRK